MSEGFVLRADSKRLTMTARALNAYKAVRDDRLPAERRNEIKTWLGLRYDRPATPERFEALAARLKALADGDDVTVVERHVETVRGTTLWTLQNYYGLEATELSLPGGA